MYAFPLFLYNSDLISFNPTLGMFYIRINYIENKCLLLITLNSMIKSSRNIAVVGCPGCLPPRDLLILPTFVRAGGGENQKSNSSILSVIFKVLENYAEILELLQIIILLCIYLNNLCLISILSSVFPTLIFKIVID